jgi:hypothetical protein
MRMTTPGLAERRPHRSRLDHPDRLTGSFRRGELAAGLAAVAVVAQCALAPVTLLFAGLLVLAGRISRWQLAWLLLPALGSACWLAVSGPLATAHALAAGAGRLMAADLAVALHPGRLLHPAAAFAGSGRWLPRELPLLLLAGTAETAIVLWPHRTQRPGLVAALRRRAAAAALAAGHTVTASGFAIGVDGSGRLSGASWAQAERGVLLTGGDPLELDQIGLAIACAAVRRRKTMLVLDLSAGGARRESAGRDARGAGVCAQVAGLAERAGVPVTCVGSVADRGPGASEAATLRAAGPSGAVSLGGAFGRAIRRRSVVLLPARHAVAAQSDAARSEPIQQALSELVGTLTSLRELGLRGDCLAWVVGCEAADARRLSELLSLGQETGTAVLLSTTSPALAADLAAEAALVVASGPITGSLAERLADQAVGHSGIAPPVGRELPIDAPLRASIGNPRPSARESTPGLVGAKRALEDLLQRQCRRSATLMGGDRIESFRIVPIQVTEVR